MSDIAPLHGPAAASYSPSSRVDRPAVVGNDISRGSDQIELSDTARLLAKLDELPEVRQDLINRIRGEIADGTYETSAKLDEAVEGLAEDLAAS